MSRARIPDADGLAAVRACAFPVGPDQPGPPDRATERLAVRYTLQLLTDRAPGHSVEVRIPPFAAVQAIPGPVHRRGTPSAVVEMDAPTWLALATGALSWAQAKAAGQIRASGERADLTEWLPLVTT
jgi:hypothetical protein